MSVARVAEREYVSAPSLRACVVVAVRRARDDRMAPDGPTVESIWTELVSEARISGALIGAFAAGEETP
jgi:hypothetical protein